jgi:hypothetical protein
MPLLRRILIALLGVAGLQAGLAAADELPTPPGGTVVIAGTDLSSLSAADQADAQVQRFVARAQAVAQDNFVPIYHLLYPGQALPDALTVSLHLIHQPDGIAWTSGGVVTLNLTWFLAHPDDLGAVYHEMVHVVQAYPSNPAGGDYGWLTEGIADWARNFVYEHKTLADFAGAGLGKYQDGYKPAARFLEWLRQHKCADIVTTLNARLHAGQYSPAAWQELTGESLDALWQDYAAAPRS